MMVDRLFRASFALMLFMLPVQGLTAQEFPTDEPVIKKMWEIGMDNSQVEELAHVLMDQIGPRLTGSEGLESAQEWLLEKYGTWGIDARTEEYGTWDGWRQGILHVDMLEPRIQTLEAEMLAWSPGTEGPVEAEVIIPPNGMTRSDANTWLATVKGKFVMVSPPEMMCRARQELVEYGRPETMARIDSTRRSTQILWNRRLSALGSFNQREARIDSAGAAGTCLRRSRSYCH